MSVTGFGKTESGVVPTSGKFRSRREGMTHTEITLIQDRECTARNRFGVQ